MIHEQVLRGLRARLQAHGDGDLAAALGDDEQYERLPEARKAMLDAAVFGVGYLLDGKRIDPTKVEVIRYA